MKPQRQRTNLRESNQFSRRKSLRSSMMEGLATSTRKPVISATFSGGMFTWEGEGRVVIRPIMQISKDPHLNVGDCNQRVTAGIRLRKRVFNQFHFSMDILKHIYISSVGGHCHLIDKSNSSSCPIFALWPCKPKVYFSRKAKYLGKLSSTPLLRFTKSPQRYCIYVSFKHLNTLIEMTACVTGS